MCCQEVMFSKSGEGGVFLDPQSNSIGHFGHVRGVWIWISGREEISLSHAVARDLSIP